MLEVGCGSGGGAGGRCGARGSELNHPLGLAGSRQEVEEKTVYIYMTRQRFGEDRTWTSEECSEGPFPPLPLRFQSADASASLCDKDVWGWSHSFSATLHTKL